MPPTGQIERIEEDIVLIMLFLGRHSGSFITTPRPPLADLSGFSLDSSPPAPPPRAHGTKSGHLVHLLHCSGKRRNGKRGHKIGPLGAGLTSEKYTELGWSQKAAVSLLYPLGEYRAGIGDGPGQGQIK